MYLMHFLVNHGIYGNIHLIIISVKIIIIISVKMDFIFCIIHIT